MRSVGPPPWLDPPPKPPKDHPGGRRFPASGELELPSQLQVCARAPGELQLALTYGAVAVDDTA